MGGAVSLAAMSREPVLVADRRALMVWWKHGLDWGALSIFEALAGRRVFVSAGAAAPEEFYDAYVHDVEARSTWTRARRRFLRHRMATTSLVILAVIFSAGLLASQIAPYGYNAVDLNSMSEAPSWAHPFGTNQIGNDYLTRVLYGIGIEARVAMLVAFFGTLVGTLVGVVAGYFGGIVGESLMRLTDLFLTLPPLIVVIVAAAYLHLTTAFSISLLLAALLWMPLARIVRGATLELREKEYVHAARALGASDPWIILRHVLPNAVGSVAVAATVMTASAIVLETTLSYLSLFARASFPSLGAVLAGAVVEGLFNWWGLFFPGLVLTLILMSIYFIGDGLRDALDPSGGRPVSGHAPRA
jgi:peptide/nickel transport system permease protein